MIIRFDKEPFTVQPEAQMCQIQAYGQYWQIRYYDHGWLRASLKLCIGVNVNHQAMPAEICEVVKKLDSRIGVLVIETNAFLDVFKTLFDAEGIRYDLDIIIAGVRHV